MKGREGTPQGLVDTPHVPNPETYPGRLHVNVEVLRIL